VVGLDLGGGDPNIASASDADSASTEPAAADPTPVELVEVQVGAIATHIVATTNLVAETQIDVVAEVAGRVVQLGVDEGDDIARDAMLVVLDGKDARLDIDTASIKAANAEALRKRAAALAEKQLVSAEELERLTKDRDLARQELAQARQDLGLRRVRAPRAGRITRRDVTVGRYVKVGDPLFELTDFSVLVADIHVAERDALHVAPGRAVELVLQAKPDVEFAGTVRRVSSKVDAESGTVKITIAVDAAPPEVRSGSFVGVKMIRTESPRAKWVPREAVIRGPRASWVFTVDGDVAHRREVVTGAEQGARVEIVQGLEVGERVVRSGHGNLADGDAVAAIANDADRTG